MSRPIYRYRPPIKQPTPTKGPSSNIDLSSVPPATSVADAKDNFDARAAAAIYVAGNADFSQVDGEAYGTVMVANFAYRDYFEGTPFPGYNIGYYRLASLEGQVPGQVGTGPLGGWLGTGDYDFVLNFYIPIFYKYYDELDEFVRNYLINVLLNVRGPLSKHESENIDVAFPGISVPETENHLFLIETARYLTNQILYQQTYDPQYDNRRNGNGLDPPATVVWLLGALQGLLQHDFVEYNARPYQDNIMMALLNLESYAYDYDVRLGARMALDYISAKVAVSSNDLRRVPPFRRRNENMHWGPNIPGDFFLRSPLLVPNGPGDYPDLPGKVFEPDPQGTWYAMLAGNTEMLPNNQAPGFGIGSFSTGMVFAGVHDYRVPDLILDLFVNRAHRFFYQRLMHWHVIRDQGLVDFAEEIYAGSPSYLISAGGAPTVYCYIAIGGFVPGLTADLGSAMPTIFIPTGAGQTLEELIQIGRYTDIITDNDPVKIHLGVAPDFACGAGVFRPPAINIVDPTDRQGPWTFLNNGHSGEQLPGYYLALYDGSIYGDSVAVLEAYDTWLNPVLSFDNFKTYVLSLYKSTRFSSSGVNSYVTQSGQEITFQIAPYSQIISSSWLVPSFSGEFAYGNVMNSAQGSGIVKISNPGLPGTEITLDMSDVRYPTRTSESGAVERAGWDTHTEVWVDFNAPASVPSGPDGDFYHPFKTLAEAVATVADGGTIKMVPGTAWETGIPGNKAMRLVAPIGGVTISAP